MKYVIFVSTVPHHLTVLLTAILSNDGVLWDEHR
jgi:hypothetical protein